jgi:hypothetical protein
VRWIGFRRSYQPAKSDRGTTETPRGEDLEERDLQVIRPFSWIMAFGVFTGTFSSVYVAGAILLWIEHKWPRATAAESAGAANPR